MDELLIPNPSRHDVVTFSILVDGSAVNPAYEILSVHTVRDINRVPFAKIVIRDGDAAQRNFEISNTDDFVPGKAIAIKAGLDGDNQRIFEGIITRHTVRIRENGDAELAVECRDASVKMTLSHRNRYFQNMKDSELFDELIRGYEGLRSEPQSTSLTHQEIVQHHTTDWDFLLLRAEANGMLVFVEDGLIRIAKPDMGEDPKLQLTYGSSILEFEGEMDATTQWSNVKATSWDYAGQQLFDAESSEASSFVQHGNIEGSDLAGRLNPGNYEMHHSGYLLEEELQDWAEGIMLRSRLAKIRGRARFSGFADIAPGDLVKLAGVGDRFNGVAFVTAVKQELGNGMWDTHIQFGLSPECFARVHPDVNALQSSGLVASIHGLQIGKVVQLQDDPNGEDRILVRLPVIDNQAQGIWMRMASLDAGADRGAFFRPEIDDEVVVGFINDDPRHGVVLGMLHSSARPAPITAQDANHEKGFTTRSGMHVHFNDDTKTITIDTPAGNSLTLDEQGMKIEIKDQNDNTITTDSSGIKLESPMNIEIKAGVNLTLSAAASLSIGGASLSATADGNVAIEGAVAKLASQGITEIKGSLVKIN